MQLAKDVLEFGLYTNEHDVMLEFWKTEVGLPYQEMLPAGCPAAWAWAKRFGV